MRVHSVFRAAVNLAPPDGDLLTLLSAEAEDAPRGVRLTAAVDFAALGLAVGDRGDFDGEAIVLAPTVRRGAFRVDCAAARRLVANPLPPLRGDGSRWRSGLALLAALQARAATDLRVASLLLGKRSMSPVGERLTRAALDLGCGVRTKCLDAMADAVARLVGFGQGLTPAGDDFLCGFIAAGQARAAAGLVETSLLAEHALAVAALLHRTTDISAAMLRGALAGRFSAALAALAEACAAECGKRGRQCDRPSRRRRPQLGLGRRDRLLLWRGDLARWSVTRDALENWAPPVRRGRDGERSADAIIDGGHMLQQFTYLAPRTRGELHGIMADHGAEAALLAGGTDLLVNIRAGLAHPKFVVDAKKIEGFDRPAVERTRRLGHPCWRDDQCNARRPEGSQRLSAG